MRTILRSIVSSACLAWALATPPSMAADLPTAGALERSLVGRWSGALAYRDYQSNRRFELPVQTRIELGPDGATLLRVSTFDDGPQTGAVHITSVSLFDPADRRLTTATFRKGRAPELDTQDAAVGAHADARHWTLVYTQTGRDGDRPAQIRITQTLRDDELTVLKEVRPADAPDATFAFRNETVLRRVVAP